LPGSLVVRMRQPRNAGEWHATTLAGMSEATRRKYLKSLSDEEALHLFHDWRFWARGNQVAPADDWTNWLLLAGRGFGKMLHISTPIPTPDGWKPIGEMKAGECLFNEAGRVCRVLIAHNFEEGEEHIVTFSDGATIVACAKHQWVTWTHAERKAFLRSPYEADRTRFPENWPMWRLRNLAAGLSLSATARKHGISERTLSRHVSGRAHRNPEVREDSPGPQVRTTAQILETLTYNSRGDLNHCIPVCAPLALPEANLPVAPYTLGAWLGDGSSAAAEITSADEEVFRNIEGEGYAVGVVRKAGGKSVTAGIGGRATVRDPNGRMMPNGFLNSVLRQMGLIGNKHIPQIYLRASVAQRLAFLRGLMDTGGHADYSKVEFCTTREQLAEGVFELVTSLGQKPRIYAERARLNGRDCGPRWRVIWRPTLIPFSLKRKVDACGPIGAQGLPNQHRMIVSVERTGRKVLMRCLTVDSPNGMYLSGKAMIPTHNTRAGAEWVREQVEVKGKRAIAMVAPTARDTRRIMVEGPSGLLNICPPWSKPNYLPSKGELIWPNGAKASLFSAEEPERLRGSEFEVAWCDELCSWQYREDTWDMLQFTLRAGDNPQVVITTTPKPFELLTTLMKDETTVLTRGTSYDNRPNLAPKFFDAIIKRYEGTRLGRQELNAEVLEDMPGALWTRGMIEARRIMATRSGDYREAAKINLRRKVIAVDPSGSDSETGAQQGILAVGEGYDNRFYVLRDASCSESPDKWGKAAVELYHELEADLIVAERNFGGDMVRFVIQAQDKNVPVKLVTASNGKHIRAEPIAALYEQGRVSHIGAFAALEDQMCLMTHEGYQGGGSPDRVDALVWGLTELAYPGRRPGFVQGVRY
jgi:phage terminase large subunit-like protein